jgi:hypothetical protein
VADKKQRIEVKGKTKQLKEQKIIQGHKKTERKYA